MGQEAELAMQIATGTIKIMLDGSVAVLRIAGKASAHAAALLAAALSGSKKSRGKTSLKTMLKEKNGITLFTLKKDDLAVFAKTAKAYGIKYCIVKDKNAKEESNLDIFVRSLDAPVINRIIEKYKMNAVKQDVEIAGEKDQGKSETRTEKENLSGKDYSEEFEKGDVTINFDTLLKEENETSYVTRVPGTYGQNVLYLTVDKADTELIYNDSSFKYHIESDAEYELTDREGRTIHITGEALLLYYDRKDKDRDVVPAENKIRKEEELRPSVRTKLDNCSKTAEEIKEHEKNHGIQAENDNTPKNDTDSAAKKDDFRKNNAGAAKTNRFNNFSSQRTYDFDELEKKLLAKTRDKTTVQERK